MKYTDIFVDCPPAEIQRMIQQVFHQNMFDVLWHSPSAGKAYRGSKGKNLALGAVSQYYEIDFQIFALPERTMAVRLIKSNTGWWGGILGAHLVESRFTEVVNMLSNYFYSLGVYKGRNPP